MDEERYEREGDMYKMEKETKKSNYRLMKEDEIPSWFI